MHSHLHSVCFHSQLSEPYLSPVILKIKASHAFILTEKARKITPFFESSTLEFECLTIYNRLKHIYIEIVLLGVYP